MFEWVTFEINAVFAADVGANFTQKTTG